MTRTAFSLAAGFALAFTGSSQAQDLVTRLADNSPWTTASPSGGSISIVFSPDGRGRVASGLFARHFSWEGKDDHVCLSGLPGSASGCIVLQETSNGLVGLRKDGTELRLWR